MMRPQQSRRNSCAMQADRKALLRTLAAALLTDIELQQILCFMGPNRHRQVIACADDPIGIPWHAVRGDKASAEPEASRGSCRSLLSSASSSPDNHMVSAG